MSNDWREATVSDTPIWDRVDPITGVYTDVKDNVGPNESLLYTISTEDGDVGVWGSTVLNMKFKNIPLNSPVKIECLGKVKSEKTGREYTDYKVMYKLPDEPVTEAGYEKAKAKAEMLRTANEAFPASEGDNAEDTQA